MNTDELWPAPDYIITILLGKTQQHRCSGRTGGYSLLEHTVKKWKISNETTIQGLTWFHS